MFSFLQQYIGELDLNLLMDDTVGVFVTTEGDLHFAINEVDRGVAWRHLPTDRPLYVVINLSCTPAQISLDKSKLIFSK